MCDLDVMCKLKGCDSSWCLQWQARLARASEEVVFIPKCDTSHKKRKGGGTGTDGDEIRQLSTVFFVCLIAYKKNKKKKRGTPESVREC